MSLLPPLTRAESPEWIDSHEPSETDFAASFRDIARVNRFLGGTHTVMTSVAPLVRAMPAGPVTLLDLATGSADIPRALVRAARSGRFGPRPLRVTATDNHPKVLALARELSSGYPEIRIETADAFALPYDNGQFDLVLCSLAFHHFGPEGCVRVLREMERVSRVGFVVNDLLRDRTACFLIGVLTRLVGANRLTRHDAPLSVRRAFTPAEYAQMARDAGIPSFETRTMPFYRAVLVRSRLLGRGERDGSL